MDIDFPDIVTSRYKISELLGRGGMGDVYLADDLALPRKVAIKVIRNELLENSEVEKRIERESKLHAKIGTHSNIVTLLDVIKSDVGLFIILEYVEGQTLAELIVENAKRDVKLSEPAISSIVAQVLIALAKIHSSDIIHRDIKPDNIMVSGSEDEGYSVKLMDFGIAKSGGHVESSETALTKFGLGGPGSPSYMAPEQIDATTFGEVSNKTDLYSLGIIFYELIAGEPPFTGSLTEIYSAHLIKEIRNVSSAEQVTNRWSTVIAKALEKKQVDRYEDASGFLTDLEAVLNDEVGVRGAGLSENNQKPSHGASEFEPDGCDQGPNDLNWITKRTEQLVLVSKRKEFQWGAGALGLLLVVSLFGGYFLESDRGAIQSEASESKTEVDVDRGLSAPTKALNAVETTEQRAKDAQLAQVKVKPVSAKNKPITKRKPQKKVPAPANVNVDDIVAAFECSRKPESCGGQAISNDTIKPTSNSAEVSVVGGERNQNLEDNIASAVSAQNPPVVAAITQSPVQDNAESKYDFDLSNTKHSKAD